jgi:Ras-related protein Rab-1A
MNVPRIKFIILGDSGVGKTTIFEILKLNDKELKQKKQNVILSSKKIEHIYSTTIGIDFNWLVYRDRFGESIKIELWDTGGQERFDTIVSGYFRDSDVCLLVFDLTDKQSFLHLNKWISKLNNKEKKSLYLFGNKSDKITETCPSPVTEEEIDKFVNDNNIIKYYRVCAISYEIPTHDLLENIIQKYEKDKMELAKIPKNRISSISSNEHKKVNPFALGEYTEEEQKRNRGYLNKYFNCC